MILSRVRLIILQCALLLLISVVIINLVLVCVTLDETRHRWSTVPFFKQIYSQRIVARCDQSSYHLVPEHNDKGQIMP